MADKYHHDEWCSINLDDGDECTCYVRLLKEKDERIEQLEAKLEAIECAQCEKSMLECQCDEESE